jgi:AcrR family transcriptional regulator
MKSSKKIAPLTEPDRMAEIYGVAAQIFFEKGYDAASMNDIAEAVGLTKAGLYHYISGKEALLFAIMNYGMELVASEVMAPARAAASAEQRLRTLIACHAGLIIEKAQAITIVVDELAGLTPGHRRQITQRKRIYYEFVRDTLAELKAEGKLQDVDPAVAAFSLLGMLLWLSRWYHPDGRLTPEQVVEEISKIALGTLLRPGLRLVSAPKR